MPPVITSGPTYTKTDSTIVAVWTTDVSSDSNLFAGAKPAVDNGKAASSTSHQCVVTGLNPNTNYSCFVTSGGTSSSTQTVRTNPAQNRFLVTSATNGTITTIAGAPQGDTYRSFVSNDGFTYMTQDDGKGFINGSPNASYNTEIGKITNEATMAGTFINLANYGTPLNTLNGTDGPSGAAMSNKSTGLFGLNGNLHCFVYRQFPPTFTTNRYCNWIKSTDHGATWNNFTALSTFTAGGNPVTPNSPAEPIQFYDKLIGIVTPVLYAADDGTLGYNTSGNQIDGGNAYVYCSFAKDNTPLYMLRIPRIDFDAQTTTAFEYWVGPASPAVTDFTNDANWSASATSATNILPGAQVGAWWQIAFVPGLNSYIMTTWAALSPGSSLQCYSASTPSGPWNLAYSGPANLTSGSIWYGPFPFHRDLITNTATDHVTVRIIYQGESSVGTNYKPNWSTLTLFTTPQTPSTNTFVQGNQSSTNQAAPYTLQYPSNVQIGDLLITAWRRGATGSITDVHDDQNGVGKPWTIVYDAFDSGGPSSIWGGWAYLFSTVTSSTHPTVTVTGSGVGNGLIVIGAYRGPSLFRLASAAGTTGAPTPVSPAITALAGDLLIGVCGVNTSTALTAGSGYVLREKSNLSGTTFFSAIEDNLSAAGGSITASFTATGSGTTTAGIGAFNGFAPQYTVSGSAGIAGATITYSGTASGSVTADASGNFVIPNLYSGSYTVTPSLPGQVFSPSSQNVNVVSANVTGINFTAVAVLGGAGIQAFRDFVSKRGEDDSD